YVRASGADSGDLCCFAHGDFRGEDTRRQQDPHFKLTHYRLMTQPTSAFCSCVGRWRTASAVRHTGHSGRGQGGRMKLLTLAGLVVALALPLRAAGQRGPGAAAGCDPLGDVRFICNQVSPEDLAPVPGGEWLISSGT